MFKYRLFSAAAPGLTERREGTLTPPPVETFSESLDGKQTAARSASGYSERV